MARLLADENFPFPAVERLRALGHIVTTLQEAGLGDRSTPDPEVLRFATTNHMAVLTMNRRHFINLHAASPDHAGVIACTFDPDFNRLAERIHSAIAVEASLERQVVRVNRPSR